MTPTDEFQESKNVREVSLRAQRLKIHTQTELLSPLLLATPAPIRDRERLRHMTFTGLRQQLLLDPITVITIFRGMLLLPEIRMLKPLPVVTFTPTGSRANKTRAMTHIRSLSSKGYSGKKLFSLAEVDQPIINFLFA